MKPYHAFRVLCVTCILVIVALFALNRIGRVSDQALANGAAVTAALAAVFGIFATRPVERDTVAETIRTLDETTLQRVHEGQLRQEEIQQFIEVKSSEIFLTTMRNRLETEIIGNYQLSGLPALLKRLEAVESQLDGLDIKYTEIELPARFRKILDKLEGRTNADYYDRTLSAIADTMPGLSRAAALVAVGVVRGLRAL